MAMLQQLWQRFIEPSPKITEPDQRRQASLLSSFVLLTIVLAIAAEAVTIKFIEWEHYTGYRQTFMALIQDGAGSHFDPRVVPVFVELLERKSLL